MMAKAKKNSLDIQSLPDTGTIEKNDSNTVINTTEPITEEVEVIGIAKAEELQKSGWQLIDCHLTPDGKFFKYRKVNK
jgi:hypothetical protein